MALEQYPDSSPPRLRLQPHEVAALRDRCAREMAIEWTLLGSVLVVALGLPLFVLGGLRFRRWAVEDRPGIPRYSENTETIMLWLIYSFGVSLCIVVIRQTLRHL